MRLDEPRAGIMVRLGFPGGRLAGGYAVSALLNAVGTGLFYPFSILYLHGELGLSLGFIGAGLGVATLLSVTAVGVIGRRIDAIGARRVLVAVVALRIVSRIGYLLGADPAVFLVAAFLDAACMRLSQLSEQVLIAGLSTEDDRPNWYALSRTALNAGMGLGSVAGGVLIAVSGGYTVLLYGNMVGFAVAALLYSRLPSIVAVSSPERSRMSRKVLRDKVFLLICGADAVLWLCGLVFELALPITVVEHGHAPGWVVSWTFALNTVLVTVLQGLATRGLRWLTLFRAVALGAVLYAGGMLLMIFAGSGLWTVLVVSTLAVVVYTAGEIISGVAGTTAIANLAPAHARGSYMSLSHMMLGVASTLAPILMAVTMRVGPWLTWLVLAAASLVVAVRIAAANRAAEERLS